MTANITSLIVAFGGVLLLGMVATPGLEYEGSVYLALLGLAFLCIGVCISVIDMAEQQYRDRRRRR